MKKSKKVLSAILIAATIFSVTACGSSTSTTTAPLKFNEGSYTSVGQGKGGDVSVTTVFSKDAIVSVTVGDNKETPEISKPAKERIPADIVKNQSLAVDTVTGATLTSNAILAAVADAVTKAGGDVNALKNRKIAKANVPDEELTTDVVVIGGGLSGTSAAVTALTGGAKVVILEATNAVGGAGAVAGGTTFSVGSKVQKSTKDNQTMTKETLDYLMNYIHDRGNYQIVKNFLTQSGSAIDMMVDSGFVFSPNGEIQRMLPNTEKRFDATYKKIAELGGKLLLETSGESLIKGDNGAIVGVVAKKANGGKLTIHAKSVVIATGGFGGNKEMMAKYIPAYTPLVENTGMSYDGKGFEMAWNIGAAKGAFGIQSHNHTMPLIAQKDGIDTVNATSDLSIVANAPLLWLNQNGARFFNEDIMYDPSLSGNVVYSQGKAFVVFDQATLDSFAQKGTVVKPWRGAKDQPLTKLVAQIDQGIKSGYAYKGETLADLAKAAGMTPATTQQNVTSYNTMVKNKVDTDFGKSTANLMYTIEKGPFYAVEIRSRYLTTLGGLSMSKDFEVLNDKFATIPGLFASGVDAAEWMGTSYPNINGVTLGWAVTSGHIAGDNAAAYVKK